MTATGTASRVEDYLEGVLSHLSDLSDTEAAELTEDLPAHLAEVAAGSDEPLARQLGTPAEFAAELMASAGLGSASRPSNRRSKILSRAQTAMSIPRWEPVERWRAELRPAWWVARAGLAAVVVGAVLSGRDAAVSALPFPALFGNSMAGLILLGLAVAGSVRLGRVAVGTGASGAKWLDLAVSALVAVVALVAWRQTDLYTAPGPYPVQVSPYAEAFASGVLTDANGQPISNIYPYDRQGLLLNDVLLYDQSGRPLTNHSGITAEGRPVVTAHDTDANGAEVHTYPLRQTLAPGGVFEGDYLPGAGQPGADGRQPVRPPAVVIPPLPAASPAPNAPVTEGPAQESSAPETPTAESPGP